MKTCDAVGSTTCCKPILPNLMTFKLLKSPECVRRSPVPVDSVSTLFRDVLCSMIHLGTPVFHFRSSAVYITASTFAPLAQILRATAIALKVIYYIRSKWQVEPKLLLSLKYYRLRILASNWEWEAGLVVMATRIV